MRLTIMRTLLTDPFPPQFADDSVSSTDEETSPRIFSETAVLASVGNLLEVGADGTAIAAPGASAVEKTAAAFERGVVLPAQPVFGMHSSSSTDYQQSPETVLTP